VKKPRFKKGCRAIRREREREKRSVKHMFHFICDHGIFDRKEERKAKHRLY
jgi:hypothetical protein